MLLDTVGEFTRVVEHFGLSHADQQIEDIVRRYELQRDQQKYGKKMASTHFRKGISGDWKKHFTPNLKRIYKKETGEFLIEFGYEEDLEW